MGKKNLQNSQDWLYKQGLSPKSALAVSCQTCCSPDPTPVAAVPAGPHPPPMTAEDLTCTSFPHSISQVPYCSFDWRYMRMASVNAGPSTLEFSGMPAQERGRRDGGTQESAKDPLPRPPSQSMRLPHLGHPQETAVTHCSTPAILCYPSKSPTSSKTPPALTQHSH